MIFIFFFYSLDTKACP